MNLSQLFQGGSRTRFILSILNSPRFVLHYLLILIFPHKIKDDLNRYYQGFFYLMLFEKSFRNLFYVRMGKVSWPLMILAPRCESLSLDSNIHIGKGCCLVHSYWTFIHAKSIGQNFTCLHNVTIGNYHGLPTIGDNVSEYTGAIITGDIKIGNNVKIGAGTVINKDVPDNTTVSGNPAYIIRKNGVRVYEKL